MKNEENKYLFKYLEDTRCASKNKLINLGVLINSGGIVGILSITKAKLEGNLKSALLYFIMSICTIFLVELITMKFAKDSLFEIIKKDSSNEKIELSELTFYKSWGNYLIYILNIFALFSGVYALKLCFDYLK